MQAMFKQHSLIIFKAVLFWFQELFSKLLMCYKNTGNDTRELYFWF